MTANEQPPLTPEQMETIDLHRVLKEKLAGPRTGTEANSGRPSWYAEPAIFGVSPLRGGPGQPVVISGRRLDTATGVTVGGVDADIRSRDPNSVTAVLREGVVSGPISVRMAATGGLLTYGEDFVVEAGRPNGRDKATAAKA